jgi:hypothetical protein
MIFPKLVHFLLTGLVEIFLDRIIQIDKSVFLLIRTSIFKTIILQFQTFPSIVKVSQLNPVLRGLDSTAVKLNAKQNVYLIPCFHY